MLLAAWGLCGCPAPVLFVTKALGRHVFTRDARWVLGASFAPGVLWAGKALEARVHGTRTAGAGRRKTYTDLDLLLSERLGATTNYEILRTRLDELRQIPWRALILDEVHELRGGHKPARKRDGSLFYLRYHLAKQLAQLVRARNGLVWSSTATPVFDRRKDLFAQLDVVWPGEFGSSWHFLNRFCDGHLNQWGGLDAEGETHTEELQARLAGKFVILHRSDLADQLPPVTRDLRLVTVESHSYAHLGGGLETALDHAAELKLPFVLDLVAEYLTNQLKVVVVTTRRRLAYQLGLALSDPKFLRQLPRHVRDAVQFQVITRDIEAKRRIALIEEFNARECGPAGLVASQGAIRESCDLQQTDGVIIGGLPWEPAALWQFEGRFTRLGGRPVTLHYLFVEGTVEETIQHLVVEKMAAIESLGTETQGDGGTRRTLSGELNSDEILRQLQAALLELDQPDTNQEPN